MVLKDPAGRVILSPKEARAVVFWLSPEAKSKWRGGSNQIIDQVYDEMNAALHTPITPKRWKWLE